jgi:POT family proton-dependent oligopeptide transporter
VIAGHHPISAPLCGLFKRQICELDSASFTQDLKMSYRTSPADLTGMPSGIPHIIGNEAAERFSFYGMKGILAVFMAQYLHVMDAGGGAAMNEAQASANYHYFNVLVYATPLLGALLADIFIGKYLTIMLLSIVYCIGHACLAAMGIYGNAPAWLMVGLGLIALGSGGIKPCVSAHVGDQFGARNSHLLPKIFNWFYFSINLGALVSMLLTPWLLEWHGPHWAFGVPGVLMALATLVFWIGRKRFIHVPPGGRRFTKEILSKEGISALLKLLPLYVFIAIFWALFDQTGSTWIFQANDMDRNFLGFEWLPSQIQSLNSLFVLTFIPLFAYVLYPTVDRVWRLTPLRKIGLGLFIMAGSFSLVALVQQWIDAGQRPSISWQILAYALLTASEVMVSIVALEYAYTQAPKTMKSLVMCYYLLAVAFGNYLVAKVNDVIQIPNSASEQLQVELAKLTEEERTRLQTLQLPGYDGLVGTNDDLVQHLKDGRPVRLEVPGQEAFDKAAEIITERLSREGTEQFPQQDVVREAIADLRDAWGTPLRYEILNSLRVRLISDGPDHKPNSKWDVGMIIDLEPPPLPKQDSWADALRPDEPWLTRRKRELGVEIDTPEQAATTATFTTTMFSGGQTKLQGAAYFEAFSWLMLATAVAFVPFALLYRPKTYLQD